MRPQGYGRRFGATWNGTGSDTGGQGNWCRSVLSQSVNRIWSGSCPSGVAAWPQRRRQHTVVSSTASKTDRT